MLPEELSQPALQKRGESALQVLAFHGLAMRGQLIHELRQNLRDVAGNLARVETRLRRNLLELIGAENLFDILSGRRRIRAGAHPTFHEVTETVAAKFLHQPADPAVACDEAGDRAHEAALLIVAKSAEKRTKEIVEEAHGMCLLFVEIKMQANDAVAKCNLRTPSFSRLAFVPRIAARVANHRGEAMRAEAEWAVEVLRVSRE